MQGMFMLIVFYIVALTKNFNDSIRYFLGHFIMKVENLVKRKKKKKNLVFKDLSPVLNLNNHMLS